MKKEIWKDIKGYEGVYKISNFGNVKSLPKKLGRPDAINKNSKKRSEIFLKKNTGKNGYERINLGRGNMKNVHRLVAKTFILNDKNKPCVNHKDGNKSNNCVDNLEWCTYYENNRHAAKNGLWKPQLQNLKSRHKKL